MSHHKRARRKQPFTTAMQEGRANSANIHQIFTETRIGTKVQVYGDY